MSKKYLIKNKLRVGIKIIKIMLKELRSYMKIQMMKIKS